MNFDTFVASTVRSFFAINSSYHMKRLLFFVILVCAGTSSTFAQDRSEKQDRIFPGFITIDETAAVSTTPKLFESHFLLDDEDELRLLDTGADEIGFVHRRYQQYYKGVQVEGGIVATHA